MGDNDFEWFEFIHHHVGGRIYRDVALCSGTSGSWPPSTGDHRIDAIGLPDHPDDDIVNYDDFAEEFAAAMIGAKACLIVARGYIDRPLFGLLTAGTDLLSRSHPRHGLLSMMAFADRVDANMAWLYHRAGIKIVTRNG